MAIRTDSTRDGHCRKLLERFSAYLDGDLDQVCCQELELHLADCPGCVDAVEGMRRIVAICEAERRSGTGPKPAADLRLRLLNAVYATEDD